MNTTFEAILNGNQDACQKIWDSNLEDQLQFFCEAAKFVGKNLHSKEADKVKNFQDFVINKKINHTLMFAFCRAITKCWHNKHNNWLMGHVGLRNRVFEYLPVGPSPKTVPVPQDLDFGNDACNHCYHENMKDVLYDKKAHKVYGVVMPCGNIDTADPKKNITPGRGTCAMKDECLKNEWVDMFIKILRENANG